ncbi:Membrane transporter of cations and cationic drugs [Thermoplasmatales archaeon BRNA1]|nr:Membrane transporter of cations and cationic drugs [Thermoplasmatales archaeon BRNA1]
MSPWIWIALGGIFEATWAVTLSMSGHFTVPLWTATTITVNFVSIWFLNKGLKQGTKPGSSYAVWTGCGTIFSTIAGILIFDETMSLTEVLFLGILLTGVLMMQFVDDSSKKSQE